MIGSMTYEEFQQHLARAGLKLTEFASLVRMNPNSLTNYARVGEVPSHLAIIVVLLGEMTAHGVDFAGALSRLDITPKKPRGRGPGRFGGDRT